MLGIEQFAIVSGSVKLMSLSLMEVLLELFFKKNAIDIRPYFLTVPNGTLAGYDNIAPQQHEQLW